MSSIFYLFPSVLNLELVKHQLLLHIFCSKGEPAVNTTV